MFEFTWKEISSVHSQLVSKHQEAMYYSRGLRAWFLDIIEGSSIPYSLPSKYYKVNKLILSISGLWPFHSKMRRLIVNTILNLLMCTVLLMLITEIVMAPRLNVSFFIKCSMYIIPTVGNINSYNAMTSRNKILADVWIEMQEFWNMLETKDEIRIAEDYVREGRNYTVILIVFVILLFLAGGIQNMFPIILDIFVPINGTRSHKLDAPIYIPIDQEKYYVPIYLAFVAWAVMFMLMVSSAQSMSMIASEHMCACLHIVGHVLTEASKNVTLSDINEQVIRGIRLHKKTLHYVDKINSTWAYSYLAQVGIASLLTILDIIHVFNLQTLSEESLNETILSVIYIITTMLYMLIAFYVGQKILDASSKFYQTICALPWYDFPIGTQKLLMLMILRSKKDCYLTVGKTYKICYELYASIFRTAVSIGMMIYSLR